MFAFYKANIDFLEAHSIDPDKRRYVVEGEAVKHYIDLDHVFDGGVISLDSINSKLPFTWQTHMDSLMMLEVSEHGILPWNLLFQFRLLTAAFIRKDANRILTLSAEIGHYASDAHVPLHTTENYNGQLTGQEGIHALWESRIVEEYSNDYTFLGGKADYLENPQLSIWKIIVQSHILVGEVLSEEQKLRERTKDSRVFSSKFNGWSGDVVFSSYYIEQYNEAVGWLVQKRMVSSAQFIASIWYTAWVNAGQPDLSFLDSSGCQIMDSVLESEPAHVH